MHTALIQSLPVAVLFPLVPKALALLFEPQFTSVHTPHLWLIVEGGFDLAPYPAVRGWLDRLLARPAWRKAAEMVFGG